jgi:hypothetical protein
VSNAGTITTLINSGAVSGGNGGSVYFGEGGEGGVGVSNAGTIKSLTTSWSLLTSMAKSRTSGRVILSSLRIPGYFLLSHMPPA